MDNLKYIWLVIDRFIKIRQLSVSMKYMTKKIIMDKNYWLIHWIAVVFTRCIACGIIFGSVIGYIFIDTSFLTDMTPAKGVILNILSPILLMGIMAIYAAYRGENIALFIGDKRKDFIKRPIVWISIFIYILFIVAVMAYYYYALEKGSVAAGIVAVNAAIVCFYMVALHYIAAGILKNSVLSIDVDEIDKIKVQIDKREILMNVSEDVLILCDDGSVYYLNEIKGKRRKKNISNVGIKNYIFKYKDNKWKRFKIKAKIRKQVD